MMNFPILVLTVLAFFSSEVLSQNAAGQWKQWSPWSECTSICSQIRIRTCGSKDKNDCKGDAAETKECTGDACKKPAVVWATWTRWAACTKDCKQKRIRTCSTGNKVDCGNDFREFRDCTGGYCNPQAAVWRAWTPWSACAKDCKQKRTRTCSTGNNVDCGTNFEETKDCTGDACKKQDIGCGIANKQMFKRVVGGTESGDCDFPWMTFIKVATASEGNSQCSGSIIDERHVLTTAECVKKISSHTAPSKSEITVYSGKTSSTTRLSTKHKVAKIMSHPGFDDKYVNNIAILELKDPIKFDDCHRPICLPDGNVPVAQNLSDCKVMGWGRTTNHDRAYSETLRWAPQRVARTAHCEYYYRAQPKTFCSYGTRSGLCYGDSGSPFVCQSGSEDRYYIYGLGIGWRDGQCGVVGALCTDVNDFIPWIKRTTG